MLRYAPLLLCAALGACADADAQTPATGAPAGSDARSQPSHAMSADAAAPTAVSEAQPDAAPQLDEPCTDLTTYCASHPDKGTILGAHAPCIRHFDPVTLCSATPYRNVHAGKCGAQLYVSVGLVDIGYTYIYDATSLELTQINLWSAGARRVACVAQSRPSSEVDDCVSVPLPCEADAGS